jgi:hypothetical protein
MPKNVKSPTFAMLLSSKKGSKSGKNDPKMAKNGQKWPKREIESYG